MKKEKLSFEQIKTTYRVLIDFIYRYRKRIILVSLLNLLIAIGNSLTPYIVGKFFDSLLQGQKIVTVFYLSLPKVVWVILSLAILQILIAVIEFYNRSRMDYVTFMARFDYRIQTHNRLLSLPLSFHRQ